MKKIWDDKWQRKAKILYDGTKWEKDAIAAGKAIDNRLVQDAGGPYGQQAQGGSFYMSQWLAFFDYEILVRRNLHNRIAKSIL